MNLRSRLRNGAKRASEAVLQSEPDVQSRTNSGDYAHYSLHGDTNRIGPNQGDLEKFWSQYLSCPLVRVSVDIYADDVTAPGYRVDSIDDGLSNDLDKWLSSAAIVGGESHRDFSEILNGSVVQEEVRGTAMVEVVPEAGDPDKTWGFRLVNASTVEAYTYDNKAVLIRPDDDTVSGAQTTPTGEAAAYGQWGDGALAGPFNRDTVYLSQNDVIKLVQNPDTNEIFGNSSVEPVSSEIDELYRMLDDVGEAVHSKGYPLWVFGLGEPNGDAQNPRAGVWPEEKIKDYRDSHKEGNWSTNQKDFVPGDVDVSRVEGEVPEVEELLDWYVEEIVSAMPVPKYKLGFAGSINRDITTEQSPQYERKVESKRRRLQNAFTPILKQKAEEMGYSEEAVESVQLRITEPKEENPLKRDDFDAGDFKKFASALDSATGGEASEVVGPEEMRDLLGLPDRDEVTESSLEDGDSQLDEDNAEVQAQFAEMYESEPAVPDSVDDGDDVDLDTSPDSEEDDD